MQEEKSRSMSELPDEVRDFLLEPALLDCIDEIREKHALAENTEDVLIDFAEQITLGSFSLELLPQKISAELHMEESKAKQIAIDLAADRLLILFRDKQKFAKINFHSQEESSTFTPTVLVKKTEKPIQLEKKESSVPEPKAKMEVLFAKEDEQEITRLTSFVQENLPPVSQLDVSLKDAVIQVIREANLDLKDEEIKKRFVSLVEARLRDVRDPYETRSQLEYPSEKGGLGLSGLTLVRTLECIERIFGERQNLLKDQVNKQKAVMVEQKKQEEAERESLARKEASTLTKRYIEMTGKIPTESIQPASVSGT